MDILFSPYGVGGMPKATMAEIERRTEDLLKSSSFQRMLELEKKYKTERSRGPQPLLPSSQPPNQLRDGPPPRPERPDYLFPQEAFLMVKATQRTVIPPSLSITIPRGAGNERRGRPGGWEVEQEFDEYADVGTPTNNEPFQKQVKFVAPEADDDTEDGMSEQSSICQSPSWEGYGQRKKDKKLDAERRKREKEQAEKETKAAKKRGFARLSKAPPPPATAHRDSRTIGLTSADRSMSDPLLVSRHLVQNVQSVHRPEDVGRTVSADDLQQARWHRTAVAEVLSGPSPNARRARGGNVEDSVSSTIPHHLLCDNGPGPRQELRRSMSEGPAHLFQQTPSASSSRNENWSTRDAFPPSSSRTPRLRHMSPSGGNRSNGLFQGPASANNSQESLSTAPSVDGARRNGYVHYQRAQATERAMAGLADEQLVGNVGQYYPPSRFNSGQTQHTRRPSLSKEAKSAAMKLVGMKTPSSARDSVDQMDYLTFKAIPYSSSDIDASASVASMPTSPRAVDSSFRAHDYERPTTSGPGIARGTNGFPESLTTSERPPTSQGSVSSSDPSTASSASSNHSKKSRSLRDAAKAALSMSKGSQQSTESPKPSTPVPPYLRFRSRMHSRASVHVDDKTTHTVVDPASEPVSNSTVDAPVADQAKPTEIAPQGGSRVSEGSSSSSAYEDGSPLPSPTTTPDTSRPQSAKDIPLSASKHAKEDPEPFGLQDDERTLRQSPDSGKSSTPRICDTDLRETFEMGNEDRWSRTALPIDIDCDAQSFMTTVSNFDNVDDTEKTPSNSPSAPEGKTAQPEPLNVVSKVSLHEGDAEPALSIPPRSRKRSQSSSGGSSVASHSPAKQRHGDVGTARGMVGVSEEHEDMARIGELSNFRESRNFMGPFEQAEGNEKKEGMPERYTKKNPRKPKRLQESEAATELKGQRDEDGVPVSPGSPQRDWTFGPASSASSTVLSTGSASPNALTADFQIPSNPYFADVPEPLKYHGGMGEIPSLAGPPSPISLPSPLHQVPLKSAAQPRANSAPTPPLASAATSRPSTPSARSSGTAPVSILKQPKNLPAETAAPLTSRPPILSAIPKHMQLQAGMPVRPPGTVAETRMAPIAKMFVECCSCKFYHDMPSKLYECMAKPDAVVEDKLLGISGAITTMVKCPWCQHNMSRGCCAGYAAVVYLKEKLH